jgi:pilus assembly protein CpaD
MDIKAGLASSMIDRQLRAMKRIAVMKVVSTQRLQKVRTALGKTGALMVLAGLTAACGTDRSVTGSTYPRDYRERHPILLMDAPTNLDIFITRASGLDDRQKDDLKAFAEVYRSSGKGMLNMQIPGGASSNPYVQRTVQAIRSHLSQYGVSPGHISPSRYQPQDTTIVSPIRLSFVKMQAKLGSRCGQWPQDLGVTNPGFNARNEPYWNLGCATQSNVASQIANPIDLVRGQTEGRVDTIKRMQGIDKLRQGQDPTTKYDQGQVGKINQSVGN